MDVVLRKVSSPNSNKQAQMDYVPTRRKAGNQICPALGRAGAQSGIREMQMLCYQREENTEKNVHHCGDTRATRHLAPQKLIQRAGPPGPKPQETSPSTMSANPVVKSELLHCLDVLKNAA